MRKKVIIVCVLVVILVFSFALIVHMKKTPAEANESGKLEFEGRGTYVKAAFGEEFFVYQFEEPNSTIVVYETLDGIYLVGEYAKEMGTSYGNMFMPGREFIALSNEYLLFETEEGKVAVELERKKYAERGDDLYNEYLYDELSEEEKEAFVYPVERKKVKW